MRKLLPSAVLLLAGCMSGPRPYDGVIGYRAQATPEGLAVTYVDEAGVKPEKVLRRILAVCAQKLKKDPATVAVLVTGSSAFEQEATVNIPISVGVNSTGGGTSPTSRGSGGNTTSATTFQQGVVRTLALRRTQALCQ